MMVLLVVVGLAALVAVLGYPFLLDWMTVTLLRLEPQSPAEMAGRQRSEKGRQAAFRLMRLLESKGRIVPMPGQAGLPWVYRVFTAVERGQP